MVDEALHRSPGVDIRPVEKKKKKDLADQHYLHSRVIVNVTALQIIKQHQMAKYGACSFWSGQEHQVGEGLFSNYFKMSNVNAC